MRSRFLLQRSTNQVQSRLEEEQAGRDRKEATEEDLHDAVRDPLGRRFQLRAEHDAAQFPEVNWSTLLSRMNRLGIAPGEYRR